MAGVIVHGGASTVEALVVTLSLPSLAPLPLSVAVAGGQFEAASLPPSGRWVPGTGTIDHRCFNLSGAVLPVVPEEVHENLPPFTLKGLEG